MVMPMRLRGCTAVWISVNGIESMSGARALWWTVFLSCLLPLFWLVGSALTQRLGVDPAKEIVDFLGLWALRLLWLTLAVTPSRIVLGWKRPIRFRRMLGLYAFFYAVLHLLAVATFIFGWRADLLLREVSERPYVIVGAIALLMLIPLAVTSTKGWQKRLGRSWQRLHRLVYLIGVLVLVHLIWLIRASYFDAFLYGSLLIILFVARFASFKRLLNKKF